MRPRKNTLNDQRRRQCVDYIAEHGPTTRETLADRFDFAGICLSRLYEFFVHEWFTRDNSLIGLSESGRAVARVDVKEHERVACAKLTPEQQARVVCPKTQKMIREEVYLNCRATLSFDRDNEADILQIANLAVCQSAISYEPRQVGVEFACYARMNVRWTFWRFNEEFRKHITRTRYFAKYDDGNSEEYHVEDYRSVECDPVLKAWCSPDYCAMRRCLDWRARVLLALRCVEGYTLDEIALVMSITRERVRQLERNARDTMHRQSMNRQIKRQILNPRGARS